MRYLTPHLLADLKKKMVFIGGPRQCGKTTLARSLMGKFREPIYLNYDDALQRKEILARKWTDSQDLIIFDELHKHRNWKNWIKGLYDTTQERHRYLHTGSARMDIYRRGGDSLMGRYHYWRLHPFTLSELPKGITPKEAFQRLLSVGGFPEPFLDGNEREARRWRRERTDRIVRDDIRDLEALRDIHGISQLVELLKVRVGGLIVVKNLAEDIGVSQPTVKHWIEILERMYVIFVVRPYSQNLSRALVKPAKIYFFDNADVESDEGGRFENLVATHLLKTLQYLEDREGHRYELRYIRDKEGREVDFAILKDRRLVELIEAKWADDQPTRSLAYFSEKLRPARSTQICAQLKRAHSVKGIQIVTAIDDLSQLERPGLL
jgi:predicted AAA+ superfamily ATPase